MALDVAGSVDACSSDDRAPRRSPCDAADEGRELGRAVGKAEAWASTLLRFVGPAHAQGRASASPGRARRRPSRYVEEHFGRKLHAQNVAMAEKIVDLAVQKNTPHVALDKLLESLRRAR